MTFDMTQYLGKATEMRYTDVASTKMAEAPETPEARDMASVALVGKQTESMLEFESPQVSKLLDAKYETLKVPFIEGTTAGLEDLLIGKIAPVIGDDLGKGYGFLMGMPALETSTYEYLSKAHLSYVQAEKHLKDKDMAGLAGDIAEDYSMAVEGILSVDQIASLYQETVLPARQGKFVGEISTEDGKLDTDKAIDYASDLYAAAVEKDGSGRYSVHALEAAKAIGYVAIGA